MTDRTTGTNEASAGDPFAVPRWLDTLSGLVSRHPTWWIRLGDLETRVVSDDLEPAPIDRPIYVAGLARSGSTILLELLSAHPDTASHAYKDFPLVFAPWFWNRFLEHGRLGKADAVERAHGDGIKVTPDSPEAQEEMLWMAFFPHLHACGRSAVLDAETRAPAFEAFYRDHLRKLLRLRGGRRYLAKGNYNVTRLDYLLRLFPDARFVVPVRDPLRQVASLKRQHERFLRMHRTHPRGLRYMQRAGHFEFGQDRRTIEVDPASTAAIADARRRGAEAEAWARQWAAVYGHVADVLDRSPALRAATMVVRHEDLCGNADAVLRRVFAHCRLDIAPDALAAGATRLHVPDYYEPDFTDAERQAIADCTRGVAARFGYDDAAGSAREEMVDTENISLPQVGSCGIGRIG